jgi:uncharacterized peroxidase-related enzyme
MVDKAAQVMRIDWAEPGDPRFGEMDKILGRSGSVDVMRTMSLRPEWLRQMRELQLLHRQDSALDGRVKEMIATYVSSLNHCPFCVSGHAANLKKQGLAAADVDAIALGTPDKAQLSDKDRGLLAYVKLLTLRPARVRDPDIEGLRAAGWTDQQLFETSFTVALFSFYNRMADAYGLDYIPDGWQPPQRRETSPTPPAAIEDGAARSEADRPGRNR